jgi:hypothetical protein
MASANMKPCEECGSREWWFKSEAGMTVATCKKCKEEIRFSGSKVKGHKCLCGRIMKTKIIKPTIADLRREFYYSAQYECPGCKRIEIKESSKVFNH